jgi:hypothetical protein
MSRLHIATTLLAGILFASPVFAATKTDADVDALLKTLPVAEASATAIAARCDDIYGLSNRAKTEIEARKGPATIKDDFAAFDTAAGSRRRFRRNVPGVADVDLKRGA